MALAAGSVCRTHKNRIAAKGLQNCVIVGLNIEIAQNKSVIARSGIPSCHGVSLLAHTQVAAIGHALKGASDRNRIGKRTRCKAEALTAIKNFSKIKLRRPRKNKLIHNRIHPFVSESGLIFLPEYGMIPIENRKDC